MKTELRLGAVFLWCGGVLSMLLVLSSDRVSAKPPLPQEQPRAAAEQGGAASEGCISCHTQIDSATMHETGTVKITCVDCHGGNGQAGVPQGSQPDSADYKAAKLRAHVASKDSVNDLAS